MNIAFITPEYITEKNFDGGLSNYVYKVSLALRQREHNVFVFVSSYENKILQHENVTVIRVNIKSRFLYVFKKLLRGSLYIPIYWMVQSWLLNKALKKFHKSTPIDIVQYSSYTATAFFRPSNISSISRLSSYQPLLDKVNELKITPSRLFQYYLELKSLNNTDAIFGPSKLISDIVSKKIKKNIEIIESPLSLKTDNNIKIYEDVIKGKKYLLFFGSLGILKGLKEIADILPKLLNYYPDLYFVFIGKDFGYQGEPMMNLIWKKAENNRGRCIYQSSMNQMSLQPFIKNAYAVVLPSRIDNFPNTCIESMAMGKIVIGTRGASFEQLINDKENGFLCEIGDAISLIKVVKKVLNLDIKEKEGIETNAKKITERLSPSRISKILEKFYENTFF